MDMRLRNITYFLALLLVCGCGHNDGSRWDSLSDSIKAYAASSNGQMIPNRPSWGTPPSECRCWTIVIPVQDLTMARVDMLADGLGTALTKADNSLAGSGGSSHDPTVTESEPGKFGWSNGPALVRELYGEGKGGSFRIMARGLVQNANGLSGYQQTTEGEPSPQGKRIVLLETMIIKVK